MSKVIRISEPIFHRLQKLAVPLLDTPANVIERLLDYYDSHQANSSSQKIKATSHLTSQSLDFVRRPKLMNDPSNRASRQRGVTVEIEGKIFKAESIYDLYNQVLRFVVDNGYINKLKPHLPVSTSSKRYLISTDQVHPNEKDFVVPVKYKGYHMETHKDYKNGVNHLRKMLVLCGLTLNYLG